MALYNIILASAPSTQYCVCEIIHAVYVIFSLLCGIPQEYMNIPQPI